MCRVLLIDPSGWQGAAAGNRPSPNVGLAYLAASLRKDGQDVGILDLNNQAMATEQVLAEVVGFKPDIVGLSVKTATLKNARQLGSKIKAELPGVLQVVGGPHTKFGSLDLLAEQWVDVVFLGEGEVRFPELCQRIDQGKSVAGIPGVLVSEHVDGGLFAECPLIESNQLDSLPFPAYDRFPDQVIESLRASYPLVTSRGCVYRCTYCSVPEVSGKKFRKRSPGNIIEELKWAREKYRIEQFEIIDDLFNLDMERCKNICRALIEQGLAMRWSCPNGIRADRIDQELATLMFASGCRKAMVGVESANASVLGAVNKAETIADIERGIRILEAAGIKVGAFFIIGLPGDSIAAQMESVRFAQRLGLDAHFNMLVPYPGTELWKWAEKNARFLRNPEDAFHFSTCADNVAPAIETDDFSGPERLEAYRMVYTKLGKAGMLIPPASPFLRKCALVTALYWQYDREHLLGNIIRDVFVLSRKLLKAHRSGKVEK